MNIILSLQPSQIKSLYNTLSFHKTKGKIHMVLEPLQAMIQLALISITSIGTKLTIQENILGFQIPSIIQPLNRWYNSDKKDDLYFLFQVIKRYIKWYNPNINNKSPINMELYQLIIKMALLGLDNLTKTYFSSDNNPITEVIQIYKTLLDNNDAIDIEKVVQHDKVNIDEVFINIIDLYDTNIINIIFNTLKLIDKEEPNELNNNYITGLNLILQSTNKKIKDWINENLII